MGKLLERLKDGSRSGVYRVRLDTPVLDALQEGGLSPVKIVLKGAATKAQLLQRVAQALKFPDWFGGNWDALEDCLTDLSWLEGDGHVLLLESASGLNADDFGILADVLSSSARFWAERRKPFFAVFVQGPASLPPLMREKSG